MAYFQQSLGRGPRTPNYQFTVYSLQDCKLIALRRRIKEANKHTEYKSRVTVRARAPISGGYTPGGGLTLGIQDGSRWDVYIHDRL